jgi:hypothetical protein
MAAKKLGVNIRFLIFFFFFLKKLMDHIHIYLKINNTYNKSMNIINPMFDTCYVGQHDGENYRSQRFFVFQAVFSLLSPAIHRYQGSCRGWTSAKHRKCIYVADNMHICLKNVQGFHYRRIRNIFISMTHGSWKSSSDIYLKYSHRNIYIKWFLG